MKKISAGLMAIAATAVFAGSASAQVPNVTPLAIEVRAGAALPQGDFGDVLKTGYMLGGNLSYNFLPSVGVYAGYSYSSFKPDSDGGGEDEGSIVDSGFDAGVRVGVPTPMLPIDPYVRAGLIYHKLEFDGDGGNISLDSELGFEGGVGLGFNVAPKIQLTPEVSYSRFSIDGDDLGTTEDLNVDNLRLSVGVRVRI